jgi:hypothetical protein
MMEWKGEGEPPMTTEELIEERNETHGKFTDNARVAQLLKETLRDELGWSSLSAVQREAIDMIVLKISRILSGKAGELDHWDDIAGYAKLAANGGSTARSKDMDKYWKAKSLDEEREALGIELTPVPERDAFYKAMEQSQAQRCTDFARVDAPRSAPVRTDGPVSMTRPEGYPR